MPGRAHDLEPRPFRRDEYERLVGLGFFRDERVELLYGVIVPMGPAEVAHARVVERLSGILVPALVPPRRARVRFQLAMIAGRDSEPQPDILVAEVDHRPGQHPTEALILIEVAETSLEVDTGVKARLYAEAGVPEYWVVNIPGRRVELFRQPFDGQYSIQNCAPEGRVVTPAAFPDVAVDVARLF